MKKQCYVSPFNMEPDVLEQIKLSPTLSLVDCTLRDGEQQAGVAFTMQDKILIAKMLDEIRIPEIEVGMPAVSDEDKKATYEIVKSLK